MTASPMAISVLRHFLCLWLGLFLAPSSTAATININSDVAHEHIRKLENYFNGFTTLQSPFIQINPDGSTAEGHLYLKRTPTSQFTKMRFEYQPPTPYLMLSNGDFLIYVDKELQEISHLPLDESPMGFLLQPQVNLRTLQNESLRINSLTVDSQFLQLNISNRQASDVESVDLIFNRTPLYLRQWRINAGTVSGSIRVSLLSPLTGGYLDDSLFHFEPNW